MVDASPAGIRKVARPVTGRGPRLDDDQLGVFPPALGLRVDVLLDLVAVLVLDVQAAGHGVVGGAEDIHTRISQPVKGLAELPAGLPDVPTPHTTDAMALRVVEAMQERPALALRVAEDIPADPGNAAPWTAEQRYSMELLAHPRRAPGRRCERSRVGSAARVDAVSDHCAGVPGWMFLLLWNTFSGS
jgi:hypothetical protein